MTTTSSGRKTFAGGLVGIVETVTNSYSLGSVMGGDQDNLGGLVGGYEGVTVESAYAVGAVSDAVRSGGFGGRVPDGTFKNAYWDMDTSGQSQACGNKCPDVKGLTDAELKSGLPEGFNPKIWAQDPNVNDGYPYLRNNPPENVAKPD